MTSHKSDCAVHNEPAMKAGPCDCGAGIVETMARALFEADDPNAKWDAILSWVGHPDDSHGFAKKEVEKYRKRARAALTAALDCMMEPRWISVMAHAICENMAEQERMQGIMDIRDKWPDDAEIHCDDLARAGLTQLLKEALP